MPYRVGVVRPEFPPMEYDSGDYPTGLARTLEAIDYEHVKELQGKLVEGKYHGIGIASFVKSTGAGPPYEGARVRVTEGDQVAVYLGIATMGQGHETSMAQICADGLGVPMEYVTIYHGDTDLMPTGGGTYADRGTVLAGSAVLMASQEMRQKVLSIAAGYLDVDPIELELVQGQVRRVGSTIEGPLLDLGQVLELASPTSRYNQGEMGLDVTTYFKLPNTPYAYGNHATHVAIDAETGQMDILPLHRGGGCGDSHKSAAGHGPSSRLGGPRHRRHRPRRPSLRPSRPALWPPPSWTTCCPQLWTSPTWRRSTST